MGGLEPGDRREEKRAVEKRKGIQLDKGALHGKLAHTEAETDEVTQSRVALTEREGEQQSAALFVVPSYVGTCRQRSAKEGPEHGGEGREGYGVLVLNPNENYLEVEKPAKVSPNDFSTEPSDEPAEKRERKDEQESKKKREFYEKYRNPQKETETERIPIRENSSSEEHVLYVWDQFVFKAAAKNIFIIAHSYGGLSFVELICYCNAVK
ncbi:hypothetical protein CRENBAI_002662 [Crenichthys baileyi]|uniref:Arb2 domain-containing protein n=1 Tax=Crenichthys baileyi TaxID=28760 RepID=A0AAV9QPL9_9TELE